MPNPTISTLKTMPREKLAALLRDASPSLAIIDVRDTDYIGGHIATSQHVPVHTHDHAMPELVRKLRDADVVVFHCALSQQRGPASALRYLRERERMGLGGFGSGSGEGNGQEVFVLEGGFVKWQEV